MAHKIIRFENQLTGLTREAPVGFSWTVFLFGPFPPLFRGDWKWFVIIFLIGSITFGISNFVFCFIYNGLYIKELKNDGFKESNYGDKNDNNLNNNKINNFAIDFIEEIKNNTVDDIKKIKKTFPLILLYTIAFILLFSNTIYLSTIGFSWQSSIGFLTSLILFFVITPKLKENKLSKSILAFMKKNKLVSGFILLNTFILTIIGLSHLEIYLKYNVDPSVPIYENEILNKVEVETEAVRFPEKNQIFADFKIKNFTPFDIYKINLNCSNFSFLGKKIGEVDVNISGTVKARSNQIFNNINVENLYDDASRMKCIVDEYKNVEMF